MQGFENALDAVERSLAWAPDWAVSLVLFVGAIVMARSWAFGCKQIDPPTAADAVATAPAAVNATGTPMRSAASRA
jgi:hypothetical protein